MCTIKTICTKTIKLTTHVMLLSKQHQKSSNLKPFFFFYSFYIFIYEDHYFLLLFNCLHCDTSHPLSSLLLIFEEIFFFLFLFFFTNDNFSIFPSYFYATLFMILTYVFTSFSLQATQHMHWFHSTNITCTIQIHIYVCMHV